jgi:dUTPase
LYAGNVLGRYTFESGDRIAQIVFDFSHTVKGRAMLKLYWKLFRQGIPRKIPERPLASWPNIGRGDNGYGSTGKH